MADADIICVSPVDGRELARRPVMTEAGVGAALEAARAAQAAWRRVPVAERGRLAGAFLDALLA